MLGLPPSTRRVRAARATGASLRQTTVASNRLPDTGEGFFQCMIGGDVYAATPPPNSDPRACQQTRQLPVWAAYGQLFADFVTRIDTHVAPGA